MQIYTMEGTSGKILPYSIASVCGIGCIVTFVLALMYEQVRSLLLTYACVSTIFFFAAFIAFMMGNSVGSAARRRALVQDEKGEWFHVYFLAEQAPPVRTRGVIGMMQSMEDAEILSSIQANKEGFLRGRKIKTYLEQLWSGNYEPYPNLKVEHIENPHMNSSTMLCYTTGGELMEFRKVHIYKDCTGYEDFIEWVKNYNHTEHLS